ncbi:CHAT domain-containing protein [Micromonospora marina]|uniref:CHAT domain-containing protein n=1 Tax=Micromonospora marina TaxID=307120 RepID=UPI003D752FBC
MDLVPSVAGGAAEEESIERFKEASTEGYSRQARYLNDVYSVLINSYLNTRDQSLLNQALQATQAALGAAEGDLLERSLALHNLANALQQSHELTDDLAELDRAVDALASAAEASPRQHPDHAMIQSSLGNALISRFDRLGNHDDLDRAIDAAVTATREAFEGDPLRSMYLERLSTAYCRRWERTGDGADLDAAVAAAQNSVRTATRGSHDAVVGMSRLSIALLERFRHRTNQCDLDAAVQAARKAVRMTAQSARQDAVVLQQATFALSARHAVTGAREDIDEAIKAAAAAVDESPASSHLRTECRSILGSLLHERFSKHGVRPDLDRAVELGRLVVQTTPADHASRAAYLSNLGLALKDRYRWRADLADLDSAIAFLAEAVDKTPLDHPGRAASLTNLSLALQGRFDAIHQGADARHAVAAAREAVSTTLPEHPAMPGRLSNLSGALQALHEITRSTETLRLAVQICEQAVDATREPHPDLPGRLSNLGMLLQQLADVTEDSELLKRSLKANRRAVTMTPEDDPEAMGRRLNLASAERSLFLRTRDETARDLAMGRFAAAAQDRSGPRSARRDAAIACGELAVDGAAPEAAAEAYRLALALQSELVSFGLARDARERLLAERTGLGSDGGACEILAGRLGGAVELIEQGRAVLWSQQLNLRQDLAALRAVAPHLADRLEEVNAELLELELAARREQQGYETIPSGHAATTHRPSRHTKPLSEHLSSIYDMSYLAADRREELAAERNKIVGEIRKISGFEDFERPLNLETLLPAASGGPVVIVNVSRWRCDALLVNGNGITARELDSLTLGEATARANTYLGVLHAAELADQAYLSVPESTGDESPREAAKRRLIAAAAVEAAHQKVDETLADLQTWMWDTIAEPVLDALGMTGSPDGPPESWPRVWWCLTGPLAVLPMHSAGYHGRPGGRTLLDRVISSYTPTLRALIDARRDDHPDEAQDRLLLVDVPELPGLVPIDDAGEREVLLSAFPEHRRTVLDTSLATPVAVRAELSEHRWVHFRCHGDQHLGDPSCGGLLLRDGMLTVADIAAGEYRGDFAGLSACKTALGGVKLPDEAITLASALHYTGYRHVIAALWSVDSRASAEVFSAVYRTVAVDGRLNSETAPVALHKALRSLRDRRPEWPHRWTPLIHTGP